MRSAKTIHVISCHAEGEVGDVIVGGVLPPPGDSLWDQKNWIDTDQTLRYFLLNEPRGGVFRHVNLLVPPKHPDADMGFIIIEPRDSPPMSGSNSICVATVLLDSGMIAMREPETTFVLEAPGGLVNVRARCENGKAHSITVQNLPSFVVQTDIELEVPGLGNITVDTAFGGDSFVVVDAQRENIALSRSGARELSELGSRIARAANQQLSFHHPELPDFTRFSFCLFAGALEQRNGMLTAQSVVTVPPGKIDRSPTGTAASARVAMLHAAGQISIGEPFIARSIIDSEFQAKIVGIAKVGDIDAVIPEVSGRAWITGIHQHMLDPDDPWPRGYRVSDTWPGDPSQDDRSLPSGPDK